MKPGTRLAPGDVVQIDPTAVHIQQRALAGCFMTVERVTETGAHGYVTVPGHRAANDNAPIVVTPAFVTWDAIELIGRAAWQSGP